MVNKRVVIVRGGPASGKGTLATKLAELLPKPVALLEQDQFRWGFHKIGRDIAEVSSDEHRFAHQNLLKLFEEYLNNGSYQIILEGLFTWNDSSSPQGSIQQIVELANRYDYEVRCILLKASKEELIQRNSQREYSVPPAEFDELFNAVYKTVGESEVVVDTSHKSIDESLEDLRQTVS